MAFWLAPSVPENQGKDVWSRLIPSREKLANVRQDLIEIQPYDPKWPDAFESQRRAVESALRAWLVASVEHIGSTSVPGLPAKPIIDMLALVDDYETIAPAFSELRHIGWKHAPEPGDAERRKWSWCFPNVAHRTHHMHVVEQSSVGWKDWLLFRDYLRTHQEDADRYADLKRRLAAANDRDRDRYRVGKAPLINELMNQARAWKADSSTQ